MITVELKLSFVMTVWWHTFLLSGDIYSNSHCEDAIASSWQFSSKDLSLREHKVLVAIQEGINKFKLGNNYGLPQSRLRLSLMMTVW